MNPSAYMGQIWSMLLNLRHRERAVFMRLASLFLLGFSVLSLTGCTLHAHLYNLSTGEVTDVHFTYSGSGHGKLDGVFKSGESFVGDYSTFPQPPVNWGAIYASVYGASHFAWMHSGPTTMQQYGTAIASGDRGFVGDCEYVTSSITHGAGACRAND